MLCRLIQNSRNCRPRLNIYADIAVYTTSLYKLNRIVLWIGKTKDVRWWSIIAWCKLADDDGGADGGVEITYNTQHSQNSIYYFDRVCFCINIIIIIIIIVQNYYRTKSTLWTNKEQTA